VAQDLALEQDLALAQRSVLAVEEVARNDSGHCMRDYTAEATVACKEVACLVAEASVHSYQTQRKECSKEAQGMEP
jgi:hypothetical protein